METSAPSPALLDLDASTVEGARTMAVCNACRYCEQYCPVFEAMEHRVAFASADLRYLANLCHNCGECLYACQYAPPHELAIAVPKTLARIRVRSYEEYAWPAALGHAFARQSMRTALLLAALMIGLLGGAVLVANPDALRNPGLGADFYAVVPHAVMVALFGGVAAFVVLALAIGVARCRRDIASAPGAPGRERRGRGAAAMLRDVLTLRHLHPAGADCTSALETRTPWRRRCHHAVFYGFLLCFAATSLAALYHALGSPAPYPYTSVPVLLGTAGGVAIVAGALGLLAGRRARDPALADRGEDALGGSFVVLLLLASATGLALLALRGHPAMAVLLIVHLGTVLALFVTLPYGKFVHGLYRAAALLEHARERAAAQQRP